MRAWSLGDMICACSMRCFPVPGAAAMASMARRFARSPMAWIQTWYPALAQRAVTFVSSSAERSIVPDVDGLSE